MVKRATLALLLVGLAALACSSPSPPQPYPNQALLIEPQELATLLGKPGLVLLDLREQGYQAGHIPGALSFPRSLITDPREALIPPPFFEELANQAGIGPESLVVLYDDGVGLLAARGFWAFEYYGHADLKILAGGYSRWLKERRPAETQAPPTPPLGSFIPRPDPARYATTLKVKDNLKKPGVVLLDVRSPQEYREGHIPGAVNLEWTGAFKGDSSELLPYPELSRLYEKAGITRDREVIVYCTTGIRSAHTYFVLRLLGYNQLRLYDGSYAEWSSDPSLPVEK